MNMFFGPKGAYMEWQQIYKDRSMDVETMLDRFVGDGTSVFVGTFEVAGGPYPPDAQAHSGRGVAWHLDVWRHHKRGFAPR